MKRIRGWNRSLALFASLSAGMLAGGAVFGLEGSPYSFLDDLGGPPGAGWQCYLTLLAGTASFVTLSFLMGFCALSAPFEYLLVAFKGLGAGAFVRLAYSQGVGSGSLFAPLFQAAFLAAVSCLPLVMQADSAIQMSVRYLMLSVTDENCIGLAREFRLYILGFFKHLAVCAVLSAAGCMLLRLYAG